MMRTGVLPLTALLLLACGSDATAPPGECTDCERKPPVLTFLCDDGSVDEARYATHFEALDVYYEGGDPGFPDAELGTRFTRKVALELRGVVRAPVNAYVCVRSRTTHQIVRNVTASFEPPELVLPLGTFERDHYVLQVRTGATLLRAVRFASE